MLESFKGNTLEYQKLTEEEQQKRGILGRLVGVIADSNNPTRNGRRYGKQLWENVFNDPIVQEKIRNRCFFSELDHPADRDETCSEKIAGCLAEQPKFNDKGQLCGVFDILNTPNGRILKALCDYGTTIGISSRGNGDVYANDMGEEEVDEDTYDCQAFDFVIVPAVETARLQYVTEGLSQDNQKGLRKALRESLSQESEDNRKVMKETLKHLGISLTAPKKKINEDINTSNSDNIDTKSSDSLVETKNVEVKDNESTRLANQLKEALKSKINTERQLQGLQEQLAVSDTKVKKLEEENSKYKKATMNLSKQVQECKGLNEENQKLKEQLETKDKMIKALNGKVKSLNESIESKSQSTKTLTESVSSNKQELLKLKENLLLEKKSHKDEVSSLNEQLNQVKKDYDSKLQESTNKLNKSIKLTEKYKEYFIATVDRYINSKAVMLGISPNEIKNRLNESYSLDDVDKICEDLQNYSLRMSRLPFNVSKGTKVSIQQVQKPQPKQSNSDEDDLSGLVSLMDRI